MDLGKIDLEGLNIGKILQGSWCTQDMAGFLVRPLRPCRVLGKI